MKKPLTNISHCDMIEYIEVRCIEVKYILRQEGKVPQEQTGWSDEFVYGRNRDSDVGEDIFDS